MQTKIIVTGPESSGKTTLCSKLSKHFNVPYINEYARSYINKINRKYNKSDLINIAKGQLVQEQKNEDILICDTDLITIKIWSEYKYGDCDNWIIQRIKDQRKENRYYLLCKHDIPWEADHQRENPEDREEIFNLYKCELKNNGIPYHLIEGENRTEEAIKKINSIINI